MTIVELLGIQPELLTKANVTRLQRKMNVTDSRILFKPFTFKDLSTYLNISTKRILQMTTRQLIHQFASAFKNAVEISMQPIAIAAYRKNVKIAQLVGYGIISLAVKITGFTEPIIQKLYNISTADFAQAKSLLFGALPAYVKQTMNVVAQLKHFYTMSFNSVTQAMLIHKNQAKGTLDFIKDFAYIATKVRVGELRSVYGVSEATLKSSTLFGISNAISGINSTQLKSAMKDNSTFNLEQATIGEMMTFVKKNQTQVDNYTLASFKSHFAQRVYVSGMIAKQPIAIAAYRKNVKIAQLVGYGIISLAVKITGFTEPIIQKLYNISTADFAQAKSLLFGALPAYVKQTMNVVAQLKHFYTMSFNSVTQAMLIHKNQAEGTLDFIKDFAYIATKVRVGELRSVYGVSEATLKSSTLFGISNAISGINSTQLKSAMKDNSTFNLEQATIGEMMTFVKKNQTQVDNYTLASFKSHFAQRVYVSGMIAKQPIAIAAYRKNVKIAQLVGYGIISLAVKITGFTEPIIQKLYNISTADFAQAKSLLFGALPAYVKQTMNVDAQLKHFYTMSFNSVTQAMLIHKNQAEGTLDFIKDFAYIATKVRVGELRSVYGVSEATLKSSTLLGISNAISGINSTQLKSAMKDNSTFNLEQATIGEMMTFVKKNQTQVDNYTLASFKSHFAQRVYVSGMIAKQPIAIAAYRKNVKIAQLVGYGIISLAVKITGFTEPIIQKLYNISTADFAQAKSLLFGALPAYVKQTMNVVAQLKHFYTMSFNSVTQAMLIHKNQAEGTLDFIKDFAYIATKVRVGELRSVYGVSEATLKSSTLFGISNAISGINSTQLKSAMKDNSTFNLEQATIGEMMTFVKKNQTQVDNYTLASFKSHFAQRVYVSGMIAKQPIAIAAYRKNVKIAQLVGYGIISLAVKITGFTEPIIQKLYNISTADFAQAKSLLFGALPAYVKQTMNVDAQLKHFYTMSFNSVTQAMLIHKNQAEGTLDFIKDFAYIATKVRVGELRSVYGVSEATLKSSTLLGISNAISGINSTQLKSAMKDNSTFNLEQATIGEMMTFVKKNQTQVDNYTLASFKSHFAQRVYVSGMIAKQPIAIAAYRKNVKIAQLVGYGIISLAVKITGFTEPIIQKLYNISTADFAQAKSLLFGALPAYVKQTMNVVAQLKHFYTMSFNSVTQAMLIHKNQAEGTLDFIKDFAYIATKVRVGELRSVYGVSEATLKSSTLLGISNAISGINSTQLKSAMKDNSTFNLEQATIGEMMTFVKKNQTQVDNYTLASFKSHFAQRVYVSGMIAKQPIAIAAYRKNVKIAQLVGYGIISLAVKITGFTEPIIQKLYNISTADFAQAKSLLFGALPAYVKQTMNVDAQLKHFYTMSFNSVTQAMLIHKNQAEGTLDFIKDFAYIATKVRVGELRSVYGVSEATLKSSTLLGISNAISGINSTQLKSAMKDNSTFNLEQATIGEMMTFVKKNQTQVDSYTLASFKSHFVQRVYVSGMIAKQPIAIAAYRKNVKIAQLVGYGIISLAVKITGFTEPIIQKLYNISTADFAQAKSLLFGALPAYVKQTMNVVAQLKHFYTMSFNSVTQAMLIHKNQAEGTLDFIKDFAYIATKVRVGELRSVYGVSEATLKSSTLFGISNAISGINSTQLKSAMKDNSTFNLEQATIGEMMTFVKKNQTQVDNYTLASFKSHFAQRVYVSGMIAKQPIAIAAYRKNVKIAQLVGYGIISLAVKITGFTEPIIQKLYNISTADFAQAKSLLFGALPAYVKQTMNVVAQLKHFYTMSFNSVTQAMLIHKNQAEGTLDFIKDFAYIATKVRVGELRSVYGVSEATLKSSTLFGISNAISGINSTQLKSAMKDNSTFNLEQATIGEMMTFVKKNQTQVDNYTLASFKSHFAQRVYVSGMIAKQPIAIAAYRKNVKIAQLVGYGIISLAVKITGFTEPIIQKLYNISTADFAQAKSLLFGALPAYVKQTMNVDAQLKHFYTMSFNSVTQAMLIHKNQAEGTLDFIKDFAYIATKVRVGELRSVYGVSEATLKSSTLLGISNAISGINSTQLKSAMKDNSTFNLEQATIGEMMTFVKKNQTQVDSYTLASFKSHFVQRVYVSGMIAKQPIAIAAYRKNVKIAQLVGYGIISLAVKITGFTEPIIQKLYNISTADFAQAKSLLFGALPAYVKQTMNVVAQLKHFYTMSFNSVTQAMLIHKNQAEGTLDFIKDFAYIATKVRVGELRSVYGVSEATLKSSTLLGISFAISGINSTQLKSAMKDNSTFNLEQATIGEMMTFVKKNQTQVDNYTLASFKSHFAQRVYVSGMIAKQPIAIAAYRKNVKIAQLVGYGIISLAVKITGFTEPIIQKLYNISTADFAQAKSLLFGALPAYVKQTMNVDAQLKHFYTMSFNSVTQAMLIHKNQAEGTLDFIKDFAYIATKVRVGELRSVYGVSEATLKSSTLLGISNAISGINSTQLKSAMKDNSTFNLEQATIGEMMTFVKKNQTQVDNYTLASFKSHFAQRVYVSGMIAKQPIAIAAYRKNVKIAQLVGYGIISLAVKITGFTEPIIQKLYNISTADFAQAKSLLFGALPAYVKQTMNVVAQLKHFYTMSFNSVTQAMLIHKNQAEGTLDFIKDFAYIATKVRVGELRSVYGVSEATLKSSTLLGISNAISGINSTQLKSAMKDNSTFNLEQATIGEMMAFVKKNQTQVDNYTLASFKSHFAQRVYVSGMIAKQPIAIAAYRKNVKIAQLVGYGIISLAVKITGLTEPIIQKLYNISTADFAQAKSLLFGALPAYVKQTMNVVAQLKHFYTMSFNSVTQAMLIHKNQAEGTLDFIKDFAYIATKVRVGELRSVYGVSEATLKSSTLLGISNAISGINSTQLKSAMKDNSTFNLEQATIGEMMTFVKKNQTQVDNYTLASFKSHFAQRVYVSGMIAKQPIAIAAYRKNVKIAQLVGYGIISLAVKITGFTEPIIQKLYNISTADFAQAKSLLFGALPAYVKQTMNVVAQLKHFYTMSFNSVTQAMLIHKNQAEGTLDFIKDFAYIATKVRVGELRSVYGVSEATLKSSTLLGISNAISGINSTQLKSAMKDNSTFNLEQATIGEMMTFVKKNQTQVDNYTLASFKSHFAQRVYVSGMIAKQPIAIAAYRKNVKIAQLVGYGIISLAVKITGFTEPIIQKLYNISTADFAQAKSLLFGALPAYVKQTMNVVAQLKHFYTMSFNSVTQAMLIHKNQAEGTLDFIKDFAYIATKVRVGELRSVYGVSEATLKSSTLLGISNAISGINSTQLKSAMKDNSTFNLEQATIGEMMAFVKKNQTQVDNYTLASFKSHFAQRVYVSGMIAKQPIAIAAYRKNVKIAQLVGYGIISLAVKITGLTEPIIQKLYNISTADFAQAKSLLFGALPAYVKQTMNVVAQLKHFYTMSFNSVTQAMLIHKNQAEGTLDFIKDFAYIATKVRVGELRSVYGVSEATLKSSTLLGISNAISGINSTQLKLALNDDFSRSWQNVSLSEVMSFLNMDQSMVDNFTIFHLRSKFVTSLRPGMVAAVKPIVYVAYRQGILRSQLVSMNIISLATKLTNLTGLMIKGLYDIPDADFNNTRRFQFGHLPSYVKQIVGIHSELKHYYTMSFDSIAKAILVHKNITEGTVDFIKDFQFLASNVKIIDLSKIYGLPVALIKQKTLPEFLNFMAGTNLTVVTRLNKYETDALSSCTIQEAHYFLKSRLGDVRLDNATINYFIQSVIAKSKSVPGFFAQLDRIQSGSLMESSLLQLTNLAGLSESAVHLLLRSSWISVNFFNRIKKLTLQSLVERKFVSISTVNIRSKTVMNTLQSIKNFQGEFFISQICMLKVCTE